MITMGISRSWPRFNDDEIQAVVNVLRSGRVNYWTGEEGQFFEKEFSQYCNCGYAVALSNGTVALELALAAIGVRSEDEVLISSRTFFATASAVIKCGAAYICRCKSNKSKYHGRYNRAVNISKNESDYSGSFGRMAL